MKTHKGEYQTTNRSKHYLKCHLIFVCKYRKSVLVGEIAHDLKMICERIANCSDFDIEVMETDKDHIHFMIRYIPRLSISQIVRRLKQETTRQLWQLHGATLKKYYWGKKKLWTDGYFVCSIGIASPETIRKYILSQG